VEVGQHILALNILNPELDVTERLVLILLEISKRDLDDAAKKGVLRELCLWARQDENGPDGNGGCNNNVLVPAVLFTGVLPTSRERNTAGALMLYHSLRAKGSVLFT
jgi:hypothetical protein